MLAFRIKDAAMTMALVPLFDTLRDSLFCNFYPLLGEMKKNALEVLRSEIESHKMCLKKLITANKIRNHKNGKIDKNLEDVEGDLERIMECYKDFFNSMKNNLPENEKKNMRKIEKSLLDVSVHIQHMSTNKAGGGQMTPKRSTNFIKEEARRLNKLKTELEKEAKLNLLLMKEVKKAKKSKKQGVKHNPNATMMVPKQKDESFLEGLDLKNGNNSMLVDDNQRENFLMKFDEKQTEERKAKDEQVLKSVEKLEKSISASKRESDSNQDINSPKKSSTKPVPFDLGVETSSAISLLENKLKNSQIRYENLRQLIIITLQGIQFEALSQGEDNEVNKDAERFMDEDTSKDDLTDFELIVLISQIVNIRQQIILVVGGTQNAIKYLAPPNGAKGGSDTMDSLKKEKEQISKEVKELKTKKEKLSNDLEISKQKIKRRMKAKLVAKLAELEKEHESLKLVEE